MTAVEMLACLTGRPCEVCKFHTDGCSRWDCIFDEDPDDEKENIYGTWEEWKGSRFYGLEFCSNCKRGFPYIAKEYNFCPNCGADMRGDT